MRSIWCTTRGREHGTYLNILALRVRNHDLRNEVLDVRRDRLLAHGLDELAELER
jgi:hypothetical protein